MSNAFRTDERGQPGGGAGVSTGACAAESLKGLIAHVATQIAEADQRHTEMLREMQARLQSLGIETRSIRDRVPGAYVPAFDRIEEGMQLLAERIVSTHEGRAETRSGIAVAASPQAVPAQSHGAAAPPAPATSQTAQAGDFAETAHFTETAHAADEGEPWSREAADALADLYHSGDAAPPLGFRHAMIDPEADTHAGTESLLAGAAAAGDIERGWLEDRFAEIARRVEQSLAELKPDSAFLALGRRFEAFEERMGSVLEDVATRSDVEGLRLIEAHISELAQHLEQTQMQLERLDGIEAQLNAVVDRLIAGEPAMASDGGHADAARIEEIVSQAAERVASQMARAGAGPGQGADYGLLAARAAEEAITRFAADQRGHVAAPGGDGEDLRALLEGFMHERRIGDEQTVAVLDTVQQAMVRVLDRIDAIELATQKSTVPAAPKEYVREQVRFSIDPRESADLGALRSMADQAKSTADGAAMSVSSMLPAAHHPFAHAPGLDREPPSAGRGPSESAPAAVPFGGGPVEAPAQAVVHGLAEGGPQRTPRSSLERLRQDFIADAQRAKLRAEAETAAQPAAVADGARLKKPGKPAAAAARPKADGATKSPLAAMPIKKILVAALGFVIVFQGANLLLARRKAEAPKPLAVQSNAVTPKSAVQQSGDPASKAAVAPGAAKTATPAPVQAPGHGAATAAQPTIVNPEASGAANGVEAPAIPDQRSDAAPATQPPSGGAPGKGASSKFVLPTKPLAPATVPETVVEDLNYEGEQKSDRTDGRIARAGELAADGVPVGISVQTPSRPPTPYDLAKLQQQQQMANLSSKLGVAAAKATPAALLPDSLTAPPMGSSGNVATALADRAAQAKSALELPPASVGPLSLRLAAAKGDPSAEFEVGARLAEGKGTDQSFKEAVKWYTRSANQGFAQAQYRLGTLYERGLGVKADAARARVWYGRAAEQGNVKAMHNLAVLAAGSKTSAPDYAAAAHWFGEAAARGLGDSQFNLAVLYDSGLGVAKDPSLAYQWFSLAARSGDKEAVRRRDAAKAGLSPAEAAAVEARAAAWLPQTPEPLANDARAAGEAWKARENAEAEQNG